MNDVFPVWVVTHSEVGLQMHRYERHAGDAFMVGTQERLVVRTPDGSAAWFPRECVYFDKASADRAYAVGRAKLTR